MGSITTLRSKTVGTDIAEGLFNQIKDMSHDQQLQLQRDLINKADNEYTRMYGSMSDTTKLLVWYRLAQVWTTLLSSLCLQTIKSLPSRRTVEPN